MELIGAIDLLDGRARRLVQGDYAQPLAASAEPLQLAIRLISAGIRRLHIVDLDGARLGRPIHLSLLAQICRQVREVEAQARVQAGGGLRDLESVGRLFEAGADHVILGSAAVSDPSFVGRCAARWPGRVGVALDLRDGRLAVAGWTDEVATDSLALAEQLLAEGASRLVVTDISRDGTARGPNLALVRSFRQRFPDVVLLAAGGIATPADLRALAGNGADGAIVGRALLDRSLDVVSALAACTGEMGQPRGVLEPTDVPV